MALEQSQAVAVPPTVAVAAAAPAAEEEIAQPSTVVAPALPLSAHRESENSDPAMIDLVDFPTLTGSNANTLAFPTTTAHDRARSTSVSRDRMPPLSRAENTSLTTPIAISDPNRISGEARRVRQSPEQRSALDPVDNPMTPRNDAGPFIFDGRVPSAPGPPVTRGRGDLNSDFGANNSPLERRSHSSS